MLGHCDTRPRTARGPEPTPWSTVGGQDWDQVAAAAIRGRTPGERIVVNMGPQHPSTHGVLRLILEIEGETVTEARCGIGYLHTGIEKNLEYRNWTQGVTFVTRMDYLSPFFNETAYCLGVEKLLDVTEDIPERASVIRVMLMELNRISHSGRAGDRRDGTGRDVGHVLRVPRTRTDPDGVRDDHRAADEQRLHPPRRAGRRPARRGDPPDSRTARAAAQAIAGSRESAQRELHLEGPHQGIGYLDLAAAWRWASPDRCCAPPGCRTTCAGRSPTAATRPTTSTSSPTTAATPTAAT